MIANFRQIRQRIRSVENIRKITRAMEMVSSSKLNRIKGHFYAYRPYFANLEAILKNLMNDMQSATNPLLEERTKKQNIALCVIASDTGLCGTYNYNILRAAGEFAEKKGRHNVKFIAVGKEAYSYLTRHSYTIQNTYLGLQGKYSEKIADEISNYLMNSFLNKEVDETYVAYTHFSSNLRHTSRIEKFLNIVFEKGRENFYIAEPDKETILNRLISDYAANKFRVILMDALTTEHSARMLAMKTATDNADDLIDKLTLMRNKARQASITKEVLEIAMSAEALKG